MTTQRLLIRADTIVDGTAASPLRDGGVLIEGDRIVEVGVARTLKSEGAEVIDLEGCTLIPGLMDLHVHLMAQNMTTYSEYRAATFETTPNLQMVHALVHAQLAMEMGFTTLRDLGWIGYTGLLIREMAALRDGIAGGLLQGPRLVIAAWATITGSHLDQCLPPNIARPQGTTADGPWELRKLVRENIRAGADVIKTNASGGTSTHASVVATNRSLTQEELDAIVDETHAFGRKVAVHCFTAESQKMALRAGADTLEHSVFTDDEAIAMMKAKGVWLVPTLVKRRDETMALGTKAGRTPLFSKRMRSIQGNTRETFRKLHGAGVKLAMGTDTTVEPYAGDNAQELEEYVTYGMTPHDALRTATKNAAEALGLGNDLGTLEAGKIADLVAVRGDPLANIGVLKQKANIRLVMKAGRVYVDKRPQHERSVIPDPARAWTTN